MRGIFNQAASWGGITGPVWQAGLITIFFSGWIAARTASMMARFAGQDPH